MREWIVKQIHLIARHKRGRKAPPLVWNLGRKINKETPFRTVNSIVQLQKDGVKLTHIEDTK